MVDDDPHRPFPIMGAIHLKSVPWSVLVAGGGERRAQYNHGQSLQKLASRGGLCPGEAVDLIKDRPRRTGAQMKEDAILDETLLFQWSHMILRDILTKKKRAIAQTINP